jgi:hypothetical protein
MEHKKEAFDARGFLDLLGEVMDHDVIGVLNVRIHVRDGMAWAGAHAADRTRGRGCSRCRPHACAAR